MQVHVLPVMQDNYVFILRCDEANKTAVVDPAVFGPVRDFLRQKGWNLDRIFNTHHHPDHVGGNKRLVDEYQCRVYGCQKDADRIPCITDEFEDGDTFEFGNQKCNVMEVFGHTVGHIAYHFEESQNLFCGDTLFSGGCGRLFEGSAEQMWRSLSKIRMLPDSTKVYCAHEYTRANLDFALSQDPGNEDLLKYSEEVDEIRSKGGFTIPCNLGREKKLNPFLRPDFEPYSRLGKTAAESFGETRKRKDRF